MAFSERQRHSSFVLGNIDYLREQRDHLYAVVDDHVNKVIDQGTMWTEGKGTTQLSVLDVNNMIHQAVSLVIQCSDQFLGKDNGSTVKQSISSPGPTPAMVAPTTSQCQAPNLDQNSGSDVLGQVLARLCTVDEEMSSFRAKSEKLLEKQTEIDKQVLEMSTQQNQVDEQVGTILREQSDITKKLEDLTASQAKVEKKQKKEMEKLDKRLDKLDKKQEDTEYRQNRNEKELNEKLAEIADQQNSANNQHEKSITDLQQQMQDTKSELSQVVSQLESHVGRQEESSNEIAIFIESQIDAAKKDLMEKVEANSKSIGDLSSGHDKDMELLKGLEVKVRKLQRKGGSDLLKVGEQFKDVESKFKMVCKMVADRLLPLEDLRRKFSQAKAQVGDRETALKKVNELAMVVSANSDEIAGLKRLGMKQPVGFAAQLSSNTPFIKNEEIIFDSVICNHGGHYNNASGVFTAPVDGFYVASLSLLKGVSYSDVSSIEVIIQHRKVGITSSVGNAYMPQDKGSFCTVSPVFMKSGETLTAVVVEINDDGNEDASLYLWQPSSFSCFLINDMSVQP